ncbi:MAG: hypothetical protein ACOCY1_03950 [Halovenus sp.]
MSGKHDPPATYQFNKLRESSGSYRVTLVKDAIEEAEIDTTPPRPVFAHIPAAEGSWIGFDVERYDSQRTRVAVRHAVTAELDSGMQIVGEFPVPLRGKLGSAVLTLPSQLIDGADLRSAERVTTIAVAPGLVLFVTEATVTDPEADVASALDRARQTLADR